jgi:hypothetical protein
MGAARILPWRECNGYIKSCDVLDSSILDISHIHILIQTKNKHPPFPHSIQSPRKIHLFSNTMQIQPLILLTLLSALASTFPLPARSSEEISGAFIKRQDESNPGEPGDCFGCPPVPHDPDTDLPTGGAPPPPRRDWGGLNGFAA